MGSAASTGQNRSDSEGQFLSSVQDCDHYTAQTLLHSQPSLVFATCKRTGFTAWHWAAQRGDTDALKLLTEAAGVVRLSAPSNLKNYKSTEAKIRNTIDKQCHSGQTALMLACMCGHSDCVATLLDHGADPLARDRKEQRTALHLAAEHRRTPCVQRLIGWAGRQLPRNGADLTTRAVVDCKDKHGVTPLCEAVWANHLEGVELLLAAGADLNVVIPKYLSGRLNCARGSGPLHLAGIRGYWQIAAVLLRCVVERYNRSGRATPLADPRLLLDGDSRMPVQLAMERGHMLAATMLSPQVPLSTLYNILYGVDSHTRLLVVTVNNAIHSISIVSGTERAEGADGMSKTQEHLLALLDRLEVVESRPGTATTTRPSTTPPVSRVSSIACSEDFAPRLSASRALAHQNSDRPARETEEACGVCLENVPRVRLYPCQHCLCWTCCRQVVKTTRAAGGPTCPFCRAEMQEVMDASASVGVLHGTATRADSNEALQGVMTPPGTPVKTTRDRPATPTTPVPSPARPASGVASPTSVVPSTAQVALVVPTTTRVASGVVNPSPPTPTRFLAGATAATPVSRFVANGNAAR